MNHIRGNFQIGNDVMATTKAQTKVKSKLPVGEKLTKGTYRLKANTDNRVFDVKVLHVQSAHRIALIKY